MKEDIMSKKKDMKKQGADIKFELVGLPPDMLGSASDDLSGSIIE